MELLVAVIGAIGGLFIFSQVAKYNTNKKQAELESAVKEIKARADDLTKANTVKDKETQDKINAITDEQTKTLDVNDLVNWFNDRKH